MNKTKIEWCTHTWNPVSGCLHGCEYCYAERIAKRFGSDNNDKSTHFLGEPMYKQKRNGLAAYSSDMMIDPYPFGFDPTFHRYRLDEPQQVKKPSRIFVVSMGDLFGDWVPDSWIEEVFKACEKAPQHQYLFLTKNPERYDKINGWNHRYDWGIAKENWWFGITATRQDDLKRLQHLPYGKANTFLSVEPLQGEIDLSFYFPSKETMCKCSYCGHLANRFSSHCQNCSKEGGYSGSFRKHPINWVIVGQQTNPDKPPKDEWVQSIIDQCREANVPVFVKSPLYEKFSIQEYPKGMGGRR